MNLKSLLAEILVSTELSTKNEIVEACELIILAQSLSSGERDTLRAAYILGPLWDGDVPSKAARDNLLENGIIEKVIVKGEGGFNACTYKGADVYELMTAIQDNIEAKRR